MAWGWCALAVWQTCMALASLSTGKLFMVGRGVGRSDPPTLESNNPDKFYFFVGTYAAVAAVAWLFSFYQFRRGSWFNPH